MLTCNLKNEIIMKKKYILLSAVLGLGLGLSSCSDYLNVDKFFKDRMSLEDVLRVKTIQKNGLPMLILI